MDRDGKISKSERDLDPRCKKRYLTKLFECEKCLNRSNKRGKGKVRRGEMWGKKKGQGNGRGVREECC